jgi:hypothetical protein
MFMEADFNFRKMRVATIIRHSWGIADLGP